jgi:hypothetical protein
LTGPGGILLKYPRKQEKIKHTWSPKLQATITKLDKSRSYQFRIKALNRIGCSKEWSEPFHVDWVERKEEEKEEKEEKENNGFLFGGFSKPFKPGPRDLPLERLDTGNCVSVTGLPRVICGEDAYSHLKSLTETVGGNLKACFLALYELLVGELDLRLLDDAPSETEETPGGTDAKLVSRGDSDSSDGESDGSNDDDDDNDDDHDDHDEEAKQEELHFTVNLCWNKYCPASRPGAVIMENQPFCESCESVNFGYQPELAREAEPRERTFVNTESEPHKKYLRPPLRLSDSAGIKRPDQGARTIAHLLARYQFENDRSYFGVLENEQLHGLLTLLATNQASVDYSLPSVSSLVRSVGECLQDSGLDEVMKGGLLAKFGIDPSKRIAEIPAKSWAAFEFSETSKFSEEDTVESGRKIEKAIKKKKAAEKKKKAAKQWAAGKKGDEKKTAEAAERKAEADLEEAQKQLQEAKDVKHRDMKGGLYLSKMRNLKTIIMQERSKSSNDDALRFVDTREGDGSNDDVDETNFEMGEFAGVDATQGRGLRFFQRLFAFADKSAQIGKGAGVKTSSQAKARVKKGTGDLKEPREKCDAAPLIARPVIPDCSQDEMRLTPEQALEYCTPLVVEDLIKTHPLPTSRAQKFVNDADSEVVRDTQDDSKLNNLLESLKVNQPSGVGNSNSLVQRLQADLGQKPESDAFDIPSLRFVQKLVASLDDEGGQSAWGHISTGKDSIGRIIYALEQQRKEDVESLRAGIEAVLELANGVELTNDGGGESLATTHKLEQIVGQRVQCWFELLVSAFLKKAKKNETNPLISNKDKIFEQMPKLLMQSVRIGQIRQCLEHARALEIQMSDLSSMVTSELLATRNKHPPAYLRSLTGIALQQSDGDAIKAADALQGWSEEQEKQANELLGPHISWEAALYVAAVGQQFCIHKNASDLNARSDLPTMIGDFKQEEQAEEAAEEEKRPANDTGLLRELVALGLRNCFSGDFHFVPFPKKGTKKSADRQKESAHLIKCTAGSLVRFLTANRVKRCAKTGCDAVAAYGSRDDGIVRHCAQHREPGHADLKDGRQTFDPRFLVFEFMHSIMLRNMQRTVIGHFMDEQKTKSSVRQMIMGAGKTSIIAPMLALLLADGKTLVVQIVPDALLPQSRSEMTKRFTSCIRKRVETLEFMRPKPPAEGSPSEIAKALRTRRKAYRTILAMLRQVCTERGVVVTTSGAIKSMFLHYIDLLFRLQSPKNDILAVPFDKWSFVKYAGEHAGEDKEKFRLKVVEAAIPIHETELEASTLASILKKFRKAAALIDEVDLVLHPLKSETNFPIGEKSILHLATPREKHFRWRLVMYILDGIVLARDRVDAKGDMSIKDCPEFDWYQAGQDAEKSEKILEDLTEMVKRGRDTLCLLLDPHLQITKRSFYDIELKPLVAKWCVLWLIQHINVAEEDKENVSREIETYIVGNCEEEAVRHLMMAVEAKSQSQDRQMPSSAMPVLNLARMWIRSYLGYVLCKRNRVDYGLLSMAELESSKLWPWSQNLEEGWPASRAWLAVPFTAKDFPSKAAEFANPEIQIGLTILAFMYSGARRNDVKMIYQRHKKELDQESASGPPRFTIPAKRFENWRQAAEKAAWVKGGAAEAARDMLPLHFLRPDDIDQMELMYKALVPLRRAALWYLDRLVFRNALQFKMQKLSASGMDLGSDMLFGKRLGFSGTPSEMIPEALRPSHFHPGSEAKVLRTLTNRNIVEIHPHQGDWTVNSLLEYVAGRENFHVSDQSSKF